MNRPTAGDGGQAQPVAEIRSSSVIGSTGWVRAPPPGRIRARRGRRPPRCVAMSSTVFSSVPCRLGGRPAGRAGAHVPVCRPARSRRGVRAIERVVLWGAPRFYPLRRRARTGTATVQGSRRRGGEADAPSRNGNTGFSGCRRSGGGAVPGVDRESPPRRKPSCSAASRSATGSTSDQASSSQRGRPRCRHAVDRPRARTRRGRPGPRGAAVVLRTEPSRGSSNGWRCQAEVDRGTADAGGPGYWSSRSGERWRSGRRGTHASSDGTGCPPAPAHATPHRSRRHRSAQALSIGHSSSSRNGSLARATNCSHIARMIRYAPPRGVVHPALARRISSSQLGK